jgi:4,5-dihydroxyphthalate decarboxylase
MADLRLTLAISDYDHVRDLVTGRVPVEGVELTSLTLSIEEIFYRFTAFREWDVSELSLAKYTSLLGSGDRSLAAIPVFPSRVFRHGYIAVDKRQVREPKDLAGKRIGVPLYAMTAAIVIRGLLQHDHGVDLSGVTWVEGGINDTKPHGAPSTIPLVRPVKLELFSDAISLNDRLESGDIAGIVSSGLPKSLKTNPNVVRLFPDYHAREKDYYRRTKIFPIMHVVVMRRELYDKHPFVAASLYKAFNDAKAIAHRKMRELGTLRYMLPWMASELEEIEQVFGGDPWPYGIEANRPSIEALVQYLADQSLIETPVPIEGLFVPTT